MTGVLLHWSMWVLASGLLTYIGLPFYIGLRNQKATYDAAVAAGDPNAHELALRWFDQMLLLIFGFADVCFNVIFGTFQFWDTPFQIQAGHREVTYSQRLKRLVKLVGWRGDRARWVFVTFIKRTDPTHLD